MTHDYIRTDSSYDDLLEALREQPHLKPLRKNGSILELLNEHFEDADIPLECSEPRSSDRDDAHLFLMFAQDEHERLTAYSIPVADFTNLIQPISALAGAAIPLMDAMFDLSPGEAVDLLRVLAATTLYDLDEVETACEDIDDSSMVPDQAYWESIHGTLAACRIGTWDSRANRWEIAPEECVGRRGLRRHVTSYIFAHFLD